MFAAIIFDFDGTLIDTEQHNFRCWQEVTRAVGIELSPDFYRSLIGLTVEDSNVLMQQHFGPHVPLESWRSLRRQKFYQLWEQGQGPAWKSGLQTLIDHLQKQSLQPAIASSSLKVDLEYKLQLSHLSQYFPIRVAGDEVRAGKPQPDIFLEAARRLQVNPSDCLVIEDSIMGVLAAHRAGMQVVFIPDMIKADKQVHQLSLAVCSSLDEVIKLL